MRVAGKNVFNEIDKKNIRRVYISKNFNDKSIMNFIQTNKIKYIVSEQKILDNMIKNNQGIIADINDYEYKSMNDISGNFILLLDHLEDPHNFGAIIRTAESRGINTIIIPKDRSVCVNETVMKCSSGTLNHVNIIQVTNLVNAINELKDMGYFIYGAEADGVYYKDVNYADKICLVVGSEGNGISKIVRKNCDEIISLPMRGHINSLNASVACAILIYGIGE